MVVYIVQKYVSRGVGGDNKRYFRHEGHSVVCSTPELAERYLESIGYYQNLNIGGSSRYVNSMDTSKYAMIYKEKVLKDMHDVLDKKGEKRYEKTR